MPPSPIRRRLAPLVLVLACEACLVSRTVRTADLMRAGRADAVTLRAPVKAHLHDGSAVLFRSGATLRADSIVGRGERWTADGAGPAAVGGVARDEVAAMHAFEHHEHVGRTVMGSAIVSVLVLVGAFVALVFLTPPSTMAPGAGR